MKGIYKIRITRQAKVHLKAIRDYISRDLKEPILAIKMLELIKSEIQLLETFPQRIKRINESPWHDLGFRKIRIKNYYVYFWIDDQKDIVHIIVVIYVKRDQERQLKKLGVEKENKD